MPSIRKRTGKDGAEYYEIRVSRGRGKTYLSRRWYPPQGWSQRAITRELTKYAAEVERQAHAGEIVSRTEKQAQERAARLEREKILTLQQYGERVYMPTKSATMAESSRNSFQGNLNRWIYPALGAYKMDEITPAQIAVLLVDMQAQKKAHATVVKVYTVLNGLFKMAYLSDMVEKNPMDKVERPKARKDERPPDTAQAYTADEISAILSYLAREPLKWRVFVSVLIYTGIRRGECCALKWADVDFSTGELTICRNLAYTPETGVIVCKPKNGKTRIVSVGGDVLDLLRQLRDESGGEWVFSQDGENTPMHPTSPTKFFRNFSKRYNVPDFHPHKLRHTFASVAITAGADVASVSETLGHSDKAVTLRMYTHADSESRKRTSEIFARAIKK